MLRAKLSLLRKTHPLLAIQSIVHHWAAPYKSTCYRTAVTRRLLDANAGWAQNNHAETGWQRHPTEKFLAQNFV